MSPKRRIFCFFFAVISLSLVWIFSSMESRLQYMGNQSKRMDSYYSENLSTTTQIPSNIPDEDPYFEKELDVSKDEDFIKAKNLVKELKKARRLYEEVRILCYVLMHPGAHNTTARVLKATWGTRCNRLIFMSTQDDPSIGAIDVGSREGYHSLWNKTRSAVKYIYNNLLYDYDWFLKADDNTYVVVDNLRYMLQAYNTDDPVYFGQHYRQCRGYHGGGAGYVLGREAVRRFVEQAMPNSTICLPERKKGEDVGMGNCLQQVGVMLGDTRDHLAQGRFWQHHPSTLLEDPDIHWKKIYYPTKKGERPDDCCSDTVISFHDLTATDFHLLEYLIYKVRVFGHIPTLPLRVPLPPDLNAVPQRTLDKYRKHEEEEAEDV